MKNKTQWVLGVFGVIVVLGAGATYVFLHREEIPELSFSEVDQDQGAARVFSVVGAESLRQMTLLNEPPDTRSLNVNSSIPLKAVVRTGTGAIVLSKTPAGFTLSFEKDGVFVIQEAHTNADRTKHTLRVSLQKGMMRIGYSEHPGTQSWVEVNTPHARVVLQEPQAGIEVGEDGHGRVWITRGKGFVVFSNGQKRQLILKGIEKL